MAARKKKEETPSGSSWDTTSGLLDDYRFDIEEAWFGGHEKIQSGKVCLLQARGTAYQEGEVVDDDHLVMYSCGDGWDAGKGGRIATHKSGKTRFTNASNMGKLIDAVAGLGPDIIEELKQRGETFEADTWEGLSFQIERKQYHYKDRETGEDREYEVPLPVEFLGLVSDDDEEEEEEAPKPKPKGRSKKAPAKKPAPKKKTPPKKKADDDEEEDELFDAVVEFATGYENHEEFVADVFDEDVFELADDLREDEELAEDVLDEDGEVWTAAQE